MYWGMNWVTEKINYTYAGKKNSIWPNFARMKALINLFQNCNFEVA